MANTPSKEQGLLIDQDFVTSTFNHVYNVLSVFDGWANIPFTTSERKCNKYVCTSCQTT